MLLGTVCLSSCSNTPSGDQNDDSAASNDTPSKGESDTLGDDELLDNITDFDPEILDTSTTIHMVQSSESLEDWQSGKTVYDAYFYVDDIMELLDSLDWQNPEQATIVGDFHFRIDIDRPIEEITDFEKFLTSTEPPLDTVFKISEGHEKLFVQYLINFDEKIVNMKLMNYSSQIFNTYAELNDNQLKILELCLKAYFGPQGR